MTINVSFCNKYIKNLETQDFAKKLKQKFFRTREGFVGVVDAS